MPCSCQLTKARAVCLHQMCSVSRCFRSLLLLLSRYCRSCVEKPLPLVSKTAVPFRRLLRVVLADGVLGVLQAKVVVWCRTAVVPGVGSVRSSRKKRLSVAPWLCSSTHLGGKLSMSTLPWKWLSALLCHALWYLVVAAGLPLGYTLWDPSCFRSNVKVPSSVTSLSSCNLAHLPSLRNCFSKSVKHERFHLFVKSSLELGNSVALGSLLWFSTSSRCLKDWDCTRTAAPIYARSICAD